jgi:3,4-dihydroxy 2-butanone 4-phosphate synthase/GTP cyclohydrolase II
VTHALHDTRSNDRHAGEAILERVAAVNARAQSDPARPAITLSYAQSLDGCISEDSGVTTVISNRGSQKLTHRLRAMHDACMVGVNTIIVDDPKLTVRLVRGDSPVSVVVDSRLRMPLERQILRQGTKPLVVAVRGACTKKHAALTALGAEVLYVGPNPDGSVDLGMMFEALRHRGIRSVLVEGGAKIITSILAADHADQVVLTISPQFLGGVRSVEPLFGRGRNRRPMLTDVLSESIGEDLIVHGELTRSFHGAG